MELRSSRSRSRTPFSLAGDVTGHQFESELDTLEEKNQSELRATTVRTTRRTTTVKTNQQTSSSTQEEIQSSSRSLKPARKSAVTRSAKNRIITSDYSSEEGDTHLQNEKNTLIEDARSKTNGKSGLSALDLYRQSGCYWDEYPKTDYTYSPYSKDRIEISPGVYAMPNMSRRTIHSANLQGISQRSSNTQTSDEYASKTTFQPMKLFNNNYYNEESYRQRRETYSSQSATRWTRIKRVFTSTIYTFISFLYAMQLSVFSKLHRLSSKVMLMDTWLLRKTNYVADRKIKRILALCLLPLLLFGGCYLLSGAGNILYATFLNTTTTATPIPTDLNQKINTPTENVATTPPIAAPINPEEIVAQLTEEQLATIGASLHQSELKITDDLITKIINTPAFQQHLKTNQNAEESQLKIEALQKQLGEMSDNLDRYNQASYRNAARLTYKINQCCRNRPPIINIEDMLTKYLNNPDFLQKQAGLSAYLQSMLIARENLETILANFSHSLDAKFEQLIRNNGKVLMEEIATKLVVQSDSGVTVSDDAIARIVKKTLAIYDADRTGLVDYAMESMGGQILTTRCTETHHSGRAVISILGVPLWYPSNTPRTAITPGISPGSCWAFQNFPGFLVVKLANRVQLEAFSVEHISKLLVPNGNVDSAPKGFEVWGLDSENDVNAVLLGEFVYDLNGDALQFFAVQREGLVFDVVELRILSNHGNPNYTCLYRFRVHGKMIS